MISYHSATFTGESIGKGRNGSFRLTRGSVSITPDNVAELPITVNLLSSRDGESAPIKLELSREDLGRFITLLETAVTPSTENERGFGRKS
jgi:hypothetical protein